MKCPNCGESQWIEEWKAAFSDSGGFWCANNQGVRPSKHRTLHGCRYTWERD